MYVIVSDSCKYFLITVTVHFHKVDNDVIVAILFTTEKVSFTFWSIFGGNSHQFVCFIALVRPALQIIYMNVFFCILYFLDKEEA